MARLKDGPCGKLMDYISFCLEDFTLQNIFFALKFLELERPCWNDFVMYLDTWGHV